jgi:hypothetical protein
MAKQDVGAEQSVLQNHYDRNRPPRAPRFQPVRTVQNSPQLPPPADANSKSRTIESYPLQWQEVIGCAKRAFRAYVAGQCGFPEGANGAREAKECLEDAIEVHFDEGGILEPGMDSWALHSLLY